MSQNTRFRRHNPKEIYLFSNCTAEKPQKAVAFFIFFIYDVVSENKEAMDLPEPKLISPLLDGFVIGEPMSDHHGVCCCPALREDTGERYIVKIISIPASQVQLDALLLTGAFTAPDQALSYFEELANGVLSEAQTLGKLTKLEGFLPYTGAQLVQMSDGTGYQVYLLSPYKRSLRKQMQQDPLTHLGAINLSLDLCSALVSSRRAGYLYVDLKPNNVFLTQTQGWRIGDLGFMPLASLKYASLPEKYRSVYTAPEITDAMSELSDTLDVYALGLILYQVYNNGQLPFEEGAEINEFPPPLYADYELAEIILKACEPDPAKRWSDPVQMGQAIVAYMQRNCVNDTPIVPPPVEVPPEPEEAEEEEFLDEDENAAALAASLQSLLEEHPMDNDDEPAQKNNDEELGFIIDSTIDETTPSSENTEDLQDTFVSQEVVEMLAQADELISHELPEPAVAPDPIDIPFPAPIVLEGASPTDDQSKSDDASSMQERTEEARHDVTNDVAAVSDADAQKEETAAADLPEVKEETKKSDAANSEPAVSTDEQALPLRDDQSPPSETPPLDANADYYNSLEQNQNDYVKKSKLRIWITVIIVTLVLAAAGYGLSYYYQNIYLQTINNIDIDGSADSIRVFIDSEIADELLSVVCTDTYGNARMASVDNGIALFSDLTPNTQYRILVEISGARRLTGVTSGSYTTDVQTEVVNFNARGGTEDGSVILSFSTNGPEPETWTVSYVTEGEEPQVISFTGHSITISNLTIGSEYLFTLGTDKEVLADKYELRYAAQKILYAQDLHLTACEDGILGVAWTMPEWGSPVKWNVRCYSDSGYDQTTSTEEMTVQFEVPNYDTNYTIEVTADGMSSSTNITVSANPIAVTNVSQNVSVDGMMNLTWEFSGTSPVEGWNVSYSIDNTAAVTLLCEANQAAIPYYPGSHYDIDIIPMADVSYVSEHFSYDAPAAAAFNQYGIGVDDLSFYMCLTPERENWDRFDVPAEFYRTNYAIGEKASFLVEIWKDYTKSEDEIHICYIVRDKDSMPVSHNTTTMVWANMWDKRFCELDIPQMPSVAGGYSIDIYFNGYHVTTQEFNIA